jgi:hypothetical protein
MMFSIYANCNHPKVLSKEWPYHKRIREYETPYTGGVRTPEWCPFIKEALEKAEEE